MTEKISSSPLPQNVVKNEVNVIKPSRIIKVDGISEVIPIMNKKMFYLTFGQNNENTMDFPSAIREVINGKKIHRLDWLDKGFYGFLNGDILSLHKPDNNNYKWILNEGDLIGADWIVI